MPSRCCVPGCKNNYDKTKKVVGNKSVFLFPKEAERRDLWLKRINRKNFVVTEHSVVCIDHFDEKFIIRDKLKLSTDAFPSKFPNQPKYLSVKLPPNRRDPSDRAAAIELVKKENKKQKEANLKVKDIICDYLDLMDKSKTSKYFDSNCISSLFLNDKNSLYLLKHYLDNDLPKLQYSIRI